MEQDKLEIEKQLLQIHYYFTDESHSIDAFVRNAMEKDLLNLMKEIANILDVNINIDSEAKKTRKFNRYYFCITSCGRMYWEYHCSHYNLLSYRWI